MKIGKDVNYVFPIIIFKFESDISISFDMKF